ncbi:MAG: GNAT family N-acetyltransferase [Candidatus Kariarchaeaceae archaeon]
MPLTNASQEEINHAIVANLYQSHQKILKDFGKPATKELFNVDGFISGVPYMMLNSLFDCPDGFAPLQVEAVLAYFKANRIPLMWFVTPRGQELRLDDALEGFGVELAKMRVPGMVADLEQVDLDLLHSKLEGFEIVPIDISTPEKLEIYCDLFMKAFEVDPAIADEMQRFYTAFPEHPTSSHFYVIKDGKPVATSTVIYEAGVAGVYNVSTLPEYQRQGIASALMAKMMLEAKEKGYQYSILHSSERGKVVYERLGYDTAFWFKRYLLRPADVGL